MRKMIKRTCAIFISAAVMLSSMTLALPDKVYADDKLETATTQQPFRVLSAEEMVEEMGAGWNLGNTMDGHTGFTPNETLWQHVETTKEVIKTVHDEGFNTIRVPVTWGTMINDKKDYEINDKWISRVQDIVDYCIDQDMYVIINIHHDGAEQTGWLRIASDDFDAVKEKYEAVWKQIAERFKDYDEHLIFESMNEVTGPGSEIQFDLDRIMELNQIFVDTVRSTGSNNAYRWLSVPGRYTNIPNTTSDKYHFELPEDTVENRIFLSVHSYHWLFGLAENMTNTKWTAEMTEQLVNEFALLDKFTSKGIPVILGEYGAIDKRNEEYRAYYNEVVNRAANTGMIVACYWDNGEYDLTKEPSDYCFTLIDRETCTPVYPGLIAAILRGTFLDGPADCSDLSENVQIVPMTDFEMAEEEICLEVGAMYETEVVDCEPQDSNDVVLWKTEDSSVATVYNGKIRARGIGTTTITAYSQSRSVSKSMKITVIPKQSSERIELQVPEEIKLEADKYTYIEAKSGNPQVYLTYRSSNEEVATVSRTGKVVAIADGVAYITVTAATGETAVTKVTVGQAGGARELMLALNVYYNDSDSSYFNNEYGEPITVNSDGTYTLTFDCDKDLSEKAKTAGVKSLENLTAIYIKDHAVTLGEAKKTNLEACNIIYDKIVVDGTELAINPMEPKSALKTSGILDTNDPINSWDGSVISDVTVTNHVLNFTTIENPKTVEVTFTLSGMVFEGEGENEEQVVEIESVGLSAENTGDGTYNICADILPGDATQKVFLVSSDEAVLVINSPAVSGEAGRVNLTGTAISDGTVTIKAYTENGIVVSTEVEITGAPEYKSAAAAVGSVVPAEAYEIVREEETTAEQTSEAETQTTTKEQETEKETQESTKETPQETKTDTQAAAAASSGNVSTMTAVIIIAAAVVVVGLVMFIILKPKKEKK